MNVSIKSLKNIDIRTLKNDCALDNWYNNMIEKCPEELDIADISRMLRQDVFSDIAVPMAWQRLYSNPLSDEMYDGQLLETLLRYLSNHAEQLDTQRASDFLELATRFLAVYEWELPEERQDFEQLLLKAASMLQTDRLT